MQARTAIAQVSKARPTPRWRLLLPTIAVGAAGVAGALVVGNLGAFDYLDARTAFGIGESPILDFSGNDPRWEAMIVGLLNTVRAGIAGIVIATVIGVLVGSARRSDHWPTRYMADVYVQTFRNIPLIIQLLFWYLVVVLGLPSLSANTDTVAGVVAFTNRAIALPYLAMRDPIIPFATGIALALAIVAFVLARRWATGLERRSDAHLHPNLVGLAALLVVGVGAAAALGRGLTFSVPGYEAVSDVGPTVVTGGLLVSAEFVAIVLAVSLERGAHIAEEVRAALESVGQGQREAARVLGLSGFDTFSRVVAPQVITSALPRISSHYQTLIKSTPVALAIGYPELVSVSKTIVNNGGALVLTFVVVSGAYLLLSLTVSTALAAWDRWSRHEAEPDSGAR